MNLKPQDAKGHEKEKLFFFLTSYTLPEINIAPENWWLGDYFPFGTAYFQGLCFGAAKTKKS